MRKVIALAGVAAVLAVLVAYRNPLRGQTTETVVPFPVYDMTGALVGNAHVVKGHIKTSPGGDTVTLSGAAAFTGVQTYACTLSIEHGGPIAGNVTPIDGSHFRILSSGTTGGWNENFICVGN